MLALMFFSVGLMKCQDLEYVRQANKLLLLVTCILWFLFTLSL
jgi:hypothetical protein